MGRYISNYRILDISESRKPFIICFIAFHAPFHGAQSVLSACILLYACGLNIELKIAWYFEGILLKIIMLGLSGYCFIMAKILTFCLFCDNMILGYFIYYFGKHGKGQC